MTETPAIIKPSENLNYYHNLTTWLSFEAVAKALNTKVSGNPTQDWLGFIQSNYPKFSRCLSFNCGNGWVERELFKRGVIRAVTGTDIMDESLSAARAEAATIGMPAKYTRIDINNDPIPNDCFDLVLNHAALHHVAKIDFVLRQICQILPENGLFVSYDYTGPHRNQYDYEIWSKIVEFNDSQAAHLRNENLHYPHMPTMLHMDASEAVHSELIIDRINRYFHIEHSVALGGRFAYQLLHDHATLNAHKDTEEGRALVETILKIDEELTRNDLTRSFFTFLVLRPNKAALENKAQLTRWTVEEEERERRAVANGGRYYPKSALQIISDELAMARYLLGLQTKLDREEAERLLAAIYRGVLRREPDEAGFEYHLARLLEGVAPSTLIKDFMSCPEWGVKLFVPPGHFYSPIVNPSEVTDHLGLIEENRTKDFVVGVNIDRKRMVRFWHDLVPFMNTAPFGDQESGPYRYRFGNPGYAWGDGSVLHAMIRHFKPKRIIEVGSGWSSVCSLDTVEHYLGAECDFTMIEPYADVARNLIGASKQNVQIIEKPVQNVPLSLFKELTSGDILFIDSTHVARTGSDVCYEIFEILPLLAPGVVVHFHDIFWPFEYPRQWVEEYNRSWNEIYILRAFLQNNYEWDVLLFNDYLAVLEIPMIARTYPKFLLNSGGAFWMQRRDCAT